jgi:DNA-binding NarL/FixJ family response regulator
MSNVRVIIVDDHPLYRQGLKQVIDDDPRFTLLAEASNGTQALQLIESMKPDLVVLDIGLPDLTGLEVAARLQAESNPVAVVMLTMLKDEAAFNKAMSFGVKGYVLKENAVSEITACMAAVAAQQPYISPSLSGYLLRRHERAQALGEHVPELSDLTVAERRILKRIADKKTSKDIAAELFVSPRTVETHRANICTKLNLKGNNSLLQFALENRELLAELQ